jgi:hypothetical protein
MKLRELTIAAVTLAALTACSGGGSSGGSPTAPPNPNVVACAWNPLINSTDAKCTPVVSVFISGYNPKGSGVAESWFPLNGFFGITITLGSDGNPRPLPVVRAAIAGVPVLRGIHVAGDTTNLDATWVSDKPTIIDIAPHGDSYSVWGTGLVTFTATYKTFTASVPACAKFATGVFPNFNYKGCEGLFNISVDEARLSPF